MHQCGLMSINLLEYLFSLNVSIKCIPNSIAYIKHIHETIIKFKTNYKYHCRIECTEFHSVDPINIIFTASNSVDFELLCTLCLLDFSIVVTPLYTSVNLGSET